MMMRPFEVVNKHERDAILDRGIYILTFSTARVLRVRRWEGVPWGMDCEGFEGLHSFQETCGGFEP